METAANSSRRMMVVIGSSAGGVEALKKFFSLFPADSHASFFVVQHLSPHYASQLDKIIQGVTSMHVTFPADGAEILPDTVYIASPDRHMLIEQEKIRITRGPKECRSRPAINVLFRSAALAYGPQVAGVIMTGLLDDGTAGLWQIKDRKGLAYVQDPREAEHSSMPDSAIEHVEVDGVGTIQELVTAIVEKIAEDAPLPIVLLPGRALLMENAIAMEGNGMKAGIMELGPVSKYTCPECRGVLVEIKEGSMLRFRCHTGHAYSVKSLLSEVNESIDQGLWTTIRAIEERIFLLRQRADLAEASGKSASAQRYRALADSAEGKYQPLRELVLEAEFFRED